MSLAYLKASLKLWQGRERVRKMLHTRAQRDLSRARANDTHPRQALVDRRDLRSRQLKEARDNIARRKKQIAAKQPATYTITTNGGARGIVDQAAAIARKAGGPSIYVGSSYRPGERLPSGQPSDHAGNGPQLAARDIGKRGVDLLRGPPQPEIDRAVVAIGKAFGRNYGDGRGTVIDTFYWRGFRVQIIHRTAAYGGHRGHIHHGVRRA